MKHKFYRKNNALSIEGAITKEPSKRKLKKLLAEKLAEKTYHMFVISNEFLRLEYLRKKNKLKEAEKFLEEDVKKILAERLAVDLYQLFLDISLIYGTKITPCSTFVGLDEQEIKQILDTTALDVIFGRNIKQNLQNLADLTFAYAHLYGFEFEHIQTLQKQIAETEGTFFDGLIVIKKSPKNKNK